MKKVGLLLIMLALALRLPAPETIPNKIPPSWWSNEKPFTDFLIDMKSTETWHDSLNYRKGNPWVKVNEIGALGGFQFMLPTLRWLGYNGTVEYFLHHKDIQIKYMIKLIEINKKILTKTSYTYKVNIADSIGKTIHGIKLTWSSAIGASHLSGAGGVQRWVARKGNAKDKNGTSVKMYLEKFNNYDMNPNTKEAYNLMHNGILALARAEQQGIRLDMDYLNQQKFHLTRKIERLENKFKETTLFKHWQHSVKGEVNVNSNAQLAHFIYDVKKIEPTNFTASGKGSTDEEALKLLGIPEIEDLLEARKLKKVRDTYLDGFAREQVDGVIHPFFNLHLVKTYRGSSDHPNFQNIPIRDEESMQMCRGALFPRKGHRLLETDFKGIEVAVNACINKDKNLLKYVSDLRTDMHGDMAKQIFLIDKFDKSIKAHSTLRKAAKNGFVFPQFYGDYFKNNAQSLCEWGKLPHTKWRKGQGIDFNGGTLSDHMIAQGVKSFEAFTDLLQEIESDFWKNRFPDYARWKEKHWNNYTQLGYFDLPTGFRCGGVMKRNEACNFPAQGSAFHCLLWSLIQTDGFLIKEKLDTKIIGQIHDSLILDTSDDEINYVAKKIHKIATEDLPNHWDWIIVPLEIEMESCETDRPWSEKDKYAI